MVPGEKEMKNRDALIVVGIIWLLWKWQENVSVVSPGLMQECYGMDGAMYLKPVSEGPCPIYTVEPGFSL